MSGTVTLHEEIASILVDASSEWMTTREIADAVNRRGRYEKRDRSLVTPYQIHGRTKNYGRLFERDGSRVRLRKGVSRIVNSTSGGGPTRSLEVFAAPTTNAIDDVVARLIDPSKRLTAPAFPAATEVDGAGLYTWWTDGSGADDLREGLRCPIAEGLIYAGQTGGTTVGGVVRVATLRSRIGGNHLRGRVAGSTFRFTLAAVLMHPIGLVADGPKRLTSESEARLSSWMLKHLSVCTVLISDRADVIRLEESVLHRLDPPINLEGMQATTLRGQISRLRRELGKG